MATLYDDNYTPPAFGGPGGLAKLYVPKGGANGTKFSYINVTKDFPWTLNESRSIRNSAPIAILKEYQVNESSIKRQMLFYAAGISEAASGAAADILSPYKELFPKDKPTGFVYEFPYFSDVNFQLTTPQWASLDTLEQLSKTSQSIAGLAKGPKAAKMVGTVTDIAEGALSLGLQAAYPRVGIMDRPKLWQSHDFRTTNIRFPLFNTKDPNAWRRNRELCFLLINQNLFNKRDFITGIPPVFYQLEIPGQHYSYASCVTNITVSNRGNMRLIKEGNLYVNVPDAYEVEITLTDMVMPSKNLFQSIENTTVEVVDGATGEAGVLQTQEQFDASFEQSLSDAARSLGNAIDRAGLNPAAGILPGGSTGDVLAGAVQGGFNLLNGR
jgi:hypothetical protein